MLAFFFVSGDYRDLIGESIPFRKFGFGSLYEFLDSARAYCRVGTDRDGSMVARAVADEDTQHLAEVTML